MPAITVKNIPDELYQNIKYAATQHRRSINNEIIFSLEKVINNSLNNIESTIFNARNFRKKTGKMYLTEKILNSAKDLGKK